MCLIRLVGILTCLTVLSVLPSCATKPSTYSLKLANGGQLRSYAKPQLNEQTRYYRLTDATGRYVLVLDKDVLSIEREISQG